MITWFSWWYYDEPLYLWRSIKIISKKILSSFSIGVLVRTLFDPWKKDVVYLENASMQDQLRAFADNVFARVIGFVMRFFTIIIGFFLTAIIYIFLVAGFLAWLLLPAIILILFIAGIGNIKNGI